MNITSNVLYYMVPNLGFFRLHATRKHQKILPCYKRYKISRILLDEKAKYQPWIIKIWMKKPKLDENRIKIGENIILHP
jgi:hypothetical protein